MIAASLSARDRVDALAALGLVLYLDDTGQLRARGPQILIDAARPAIRKHKAVIVAHLLERLPPVVVPVAVVASVAGSATAAGGFPQPFSEK